MKKIYPVLLTASAALLMACSGADTDTVDTAPEISTAKAAETQADAVGVGKAVRNYLGGTVSTGVLLLVDLDDERVVGTVTKDFGNLEIKSALKDAVSSS